MEAPRSSLLVPDTARKVLYSYHSALGSVPLRQSVIRTPARTYVPVLPIRPPSVVPKSIADSFKGLTRRCLLANVPLPQNLP